MNLESIVEFSQGIIKYLEDDKISFAHVLESGQCPGKLGFAMIATAMAAFDTYAWLLFQKFDLSKGNKTLFNQLLNDTRFFDKSKYGNEDAFYSIIRCGVMHQLYPKDAVIAAKNTQQILYQHSAKLCINSYALYCDVLEGIKKIHSYISSMTPEEQQNASIKLLIRAKIDEEAADNCAINISALPPLS
jgi:hypothetical protein